jgi:hypothetical protein
MRPPANLSRLRYHPDSQLFAFEPKAPQDLDDQALVDPLEFLARVLSALFLSTATIKDAGFEVWPA